METKTLKKPKVENPDVSEFNYNNLTGEDFANYQKIAMNLPADNEYTYEQHMASGVFKFRINEDTGESEQYLFGIKVNSREPINITKIPAKFARQMNEQVYNKLGDSNSRYYLLKQDVTALS